MQIFYDLSQINTPLDIATMTIGVFDGVHLGHAALIRHVKEENQEGLSLVFSFSNHPKSFFDKEKKNFLISSLAHRATLIEDLGIDYLILSPFTKSFSQMSVKEFLTEIKMLLNPKKIILGHDAVIGKNREGTKEVAEEIGKKLQIAIEYLPAVAKDETIISSSKIREFIKIGAFDKASLLLGRPYSIYGKVLKGQANGKKIGFPTANLSLDNILTPPLGVYKVSVKYKNKTFDAIANLGFAPTVNKQTSSPLLEVHIFNFDDNLYEEYIEVIFIKFLRPEKCFDSVETLIQQIKDDIKACQ
jgi:riboflavin kinase/FMN adenylyltransferase